jgi:hypothetical protein
MVWSLTDPMYKKYIRGDDKFIADRPWFVTFPRMIENAANMNAQPLRDLAVRM